MSALAATLAGVFVFTGLRGPADVLLTPRILIYAVPARYPAPASQTFILIYMNFAPRCRAFGNRTRAIGKRIGPI